VSGVMEGERVSGVMERERGEWGDGGRERLVSSE
jgi:hypothetical protein